MKIEQQTVDLIAALGARAAAAARLEDDVTMWQRWYNEETEKVKKLRQQLNDQGINPIV